MKADSRRWMAAVLVIGSAACVALMGCQTSIDSQEYLRDAPVLAGAPPDAVTVVPVGLRVNGIDWDEMWWMYMDLVVTGPEEDARDAGEYIAYLIRGFPHRVLDLTYGTGEPVHILTSAERAARRRVGYYTWGDATCDERMNGDGTVSLLVPCPIYLMHQPHPDRYKLSLRPVSFDGDPMAPTCPVVFDTREYTLLAGHRKLEVARADEQR